MVSEGSKISVAAIRYGHAVVISFDRITGLLNWAFADGSRSFRYNSEHARPAAQECEVRRIL